MSTPHLDAAAGPMVDTRAPVPKLIAYLGSPWLAAALLVTLTGALLVPMPLGGRVAEALGNLCHGPTFALLAAVLFATLRARWGVTRSKGAALVWIGLVLFGIATEVAQGYTGRDASVQDALDDTAGATAGLFAVLALEAATGRGRGLCWALCIAALIAPEIEPLYELWDCYRTRRDFPMLASFDSFEELGRWDGKSATLSRVPDHLTAGRWAMRVDLGRGSFPGVALYEPPPDWTAYRDLVLDLDVAPAEERATDDVLALHVKVQDRGKHADWNDRFERALKLKPGHHEIRIPLAELRTPAGRPLDLAKISYLELYTVNPDRLRTFYVDQARLEGLK